MRKYITIAAILAILFIAFCACSESDVDYFDSGYHSTYHSSYSYPVNYGAGCVSSRKVKKSTIYHPVYGKIKTKSFKNKTTCY